MRLGCQGVPEWRSLSSAISQGFTSTGDITIIHLLFLSYCYLKEGMVLMSSTLRTLSCGSSFLGKKERKEKDYAGKYKIHEAGEWKLLKYNQNMPQKNLDTSQDWRAAGTHCQLSKPRRSSSNVLIECFSFKSSSLR